MSEDLINELLRRILAADRRSANDLIEEWAAVHGYEMVIAELLEPALDLFGAKWVRGEDVSLAQGYIAAKVAEDVLTKAAESQSLRPSPSGSMGPVVLGNIEDDYHALGRKMVGIFLRTAGWKVVDLGTDVLPEDFVNTALEVEAKVIGVSAMMDMTAVNIKKVRQEIDRRNLTGQMQLAVGGAVFKLRPELVAEVGGDGTAPNAMAAPDSFTRYSICAIGGVLVTSPQGARISMR